MSFRLIRVALFSRPYQAFGPDITSFLVTLLTGKRLIPCRTQKLSPSRPMVVRKRESRSSPGITRPVRQQRAGLSFCAGVGHLALVWPLFTRPRPPPDLVAPLGSARGRLRASGGVRMASIAIPPAFRLQLAASRPGGEGQMRWSSAARPPLACFPHLRSDASTRLPACRGPCPGYSKTQHQELKTPPATLRPCPPIVGANHHSPAIRPEIPPDTFDSPL